ncbi:HupE/UreJ family protein [Paenibacillus campi]|uniref:HupE/UreJ family protein n=1 Tax=Paenibacillus campi TaxID=3106031 RepID=UPI002AFF5AD1|nr:HupE/UreJ family protein [Paenibacillus sp. SGZ-1009]
MNKCNMIFYRTHNGGSWLARTYTLAFLLVLCCSSLSVPVASAHAYSVAFTRISYANGQMTLQYALDDLSVLEALPGIDTNGDYYLDEQEVQTGHDRIMQWITAHLQLSDNDHPVDLSKGQLALNRELPDKDSFHFKDSMKYGDLLMPNAKLVMLTVTFPAAGTTDRIRLDDEFHSVIPSEYANFINVLNNGQIQSTSALFQSPWTFTVTMNHANGTSQVQHGGWLNFIWLGSQHILTGTDHLLFLLTLLALRMRIRDYVKIITSFTIAHSLTLALSVLHIVTLPSKFVESMIAASIMYVALENLFFQRNARNRWWITFLFGLIHGLGFADLLMEMNLPNSQLVPALVGFNLGIELTQLALLAIALPLLTLWHRSRFYARTLPILSVITVCIAAFWLFQRLAA